MTGRHNSESHSLLPTEMARVRNLFYLIIVSSRNGVHIYIDVDRVSEFTTMFKVLLSTALKRPVQHIRMEYSVESTHLAYNMGDCLVSEPTTPPSLLYKPRVLTWLCPRRTSVVLPAAAAIPRVLPRAILFYHVAP